VLALAVIHHLAIGRNVPLTAVIDWIIDLAPFGVIEFVPKSDPMVELMLRLRKDVFDDYHEAAFLEAVRRRADVTSEARADSSNRLLISYQAR
jgi:hypothetical protein